MLGRECANDLKKVGVEVARRHREAFNHGWLLMMARSQDVEITGGPSMLAQV